MMTRRQLLSAAMSSAAVALVACQNAPGQSKPAVTLEPARPTGPLGSALTGSKRFKVAGDDLFLNNRRQNLQAFDIAKKAGLDGIQVDMGRMPEGKELINNLTKADVRQAFLDKSKATGVEIMSLAWFAMYARVLPNLSIAEQVMNDWVDTMIAMNVKLGFMPLMVKGGTLAEAENAETIKKTVELYKKVAPKAEKAGLILGVESNCDAEGYLRFLDAVGSPNVQVFYNPGRALEFKQDAYGDMKKLGKARICALHLEQGSVPPETFEHRLGDGLIDFKKLREAIMEMGWGGWMSIARSRLKGTTSADTNMSANGKFVRELFPE